MSARTHHNIQSSTAARRRSLFVIEAVTVRSAGGMIMMLLMDGMRSMTPSSVSLIVGMAINGLLLVLVLSLVLVFGVEDVFLMTVFDPRRR